MKSTVNNVLSLKETIVFNAAKMHMLQLIFEFDTHAIQQAQVAIFTFSKHGKETYYEVTMRCYLQAGRVPMDWQNNEVTVYEMPEGCSPDDLFKCLFDEVMMLAFVLTQGRIGPDANTDRPEKSVNDYGPVFTYKMQFMRD